MPSAQISIIVPTEKGAAMQPSDQRDPLRVEITADGCYLPVDERTRMQASLEPLRAAVREFPTADLGVRIVFHPRSASYRAEFKCKLPGQTLFTGDSDSYL